MIKNDRLQLVFFTILFTQEFCSVLLADAFVENEYEWLTPGQVVKQYP